MVVGSQMVPSRVQLGDFMAKVKQTNDVQYLCYLLGEQLNHPDWKRRLVSHNTIFFFTSHLLEYAYNQGYTFIHLAKV
jgi:hypothetical protein